MANPIAWLAEGVQKSFIKMGGNTRMAWKTLGGGATKEAAEQIGRETGEALSKVDAARKTRRDIRRTYRNSINEARNSGGTNEAATEAIKRNTQPQRTASTNPANSDYINMFRNGDNVYRYQTAADGQSRIYQTRTRTDKGWSAWENSTSTEYDRALQEHLNIAKEVAESGATDSAGIDLMQFVNDHPVISGGALVGGGFLLSELLDED